MMQKRSRKRCVSLLVMALVYACGSPIAQAQEAKPTELDANFIRKIDSSNAVAQRMAHKRDSAARATSLAVALRDSINTPKPRKLEQIRADRREHAFAAGAVALLTTLTFMLYNLRTQ